MDFPEDLRYSEQHEWVRVEGDQATVGITDYAQDALGDVVFVDLPDPGLGAARDGAVCEIESTKSVSEVYAPMSGTVAEVNSALVDAPELCNRDPYGEGWIFRLALSDPGEADALMDAAAYRAFVEQD